jgi:nucleotide-binding universal stress UspA family protein
MKSIVVGLDGSDKSFRALALAFGIAKQFGAGVETVSAEELTHFGETIDEVVEEKAIEDSRFHEAIKKARAEAQAAGVAIKSHIVVGNHVKTIVRFLIEHKAELLVIGPMSHGAAYEAFTKSTCIALLLASPCPVLVAK